MAGQNEVVENTAVWGRPSIDEWSLEKKEIKRSILYCSCVILESPLTKRLVQTVVKYLNCTPQ